MRTKTLQAELNNAESRKTMVMVHVIFYPEENHYIAHCLEFDLVAQGKDVREAYKNVLDAIELQAEYALETGDLENLIQPAPPEYWRMLFRAEHDTAIGTGIKLPGIVSQIVKMEFLMRNSTLHKFSPIIRRRFRSWQAF